MQRFSNVLIVGVNNKNALPFTLTFYIGMLRKCLDTPNSQTVAAYSIDFHLVAVGRQ